MVSNNKITPAQFFDFRREFYGTGKDKYLRFGQAFINELFPEVLDADLFYQTSTERAMEMIFDRYIEWPE